MKNSNQQLVDIIKQRIQTENVISFADYMELALYEPTHGYYMSNHPKLGKTGDFTTAPEVGSLFAKCFALKIQSLIDEQQLTEINLVEIGAGSGKLAIDLVLALKALNIDIKNYQIVEISPSLRAIQQKNIKNSNAKTLTNFTWDKDIDESFSGIIIANELLDAMPVNCFTLTNGKAFELGVAIENNKFCWQEKPASPFLEQQLKKIHLGFDNNNGSELRTNQNSSYNSTNAIESLYAVSKYVSEINLGLPEFFQQLSNKVKSGYVILVDYGFLEHEYYHPTRNTGTIMCHHQHYAHSDPFINVGLQDITAHVDFSLVARTAKNNGFEVDEYSTLANFLIDCGIIDIVENYNNSIAPDIDSNTVSRANEINLLTSPAEMGELFKVIVLAKSY